MIITRPNGKKYYPVIGLEIHAELKTNSKMFCACKNNPDEEKPNTNICAICMGHPGTLPTLNKKAIEHVIKVGTSLGSEIAEYTEWDRKNYFYPDIPKGYQISQYAYPLVKGGSLVVKGDPKDLDPETGQVRMHTVRLTRIHLEEDTASSSHDKGSFSLVDFNRAGLPLMELVTEPCIHDAKTAANFAKELQLLLRTLGAGEANMEKGEMRVEANISVSDNPRAHELPYDFKTFGTKVEVKNLNSFKSVERAIEYELERHIDILERSEELRASGADDATLKEKGLKIVQETRGFDETTGKTFSQRAKEDSHDYRYFPDPDLPKLIVSEVFSKDSIQLPKLPWDMRATYKDDFAMKDEDAEMFVQNEMFRNFFTQVAEKLIESEKIKLAINYITSDIAGLVKKSVTDKKGEPGSYLIQISKDAFAEIINMISAGELSSRGAKDLIALYWSVEQVDIDDVSKNTPKQIAEARGMIQKNDPEALKKMIEELFAANPNVIADYKAGKEASIQFFVGQIMKLTKGSVNPQVAKDTILELIKLV
ncbi:MAG: Asp-tRNA(Asn)/Glu-tRNA(Gln) amidotransferase subunit GatB [Candidatus Taylorbacteria bacterium]|nr:Asp-tRNA(Asn)/Glu-tRNA(Gln) amidotransferase subunit GatB [Candidatus Taylorbacteria bacterium]